MKLLVLAGKTVDNTVLLSLLKGREYTLSRLSTVSRGVHPLEKEGADLVLLIPDGSDSSWERAIIRVRREYDTNVIVLYEESLSENKAIELGAYDCFKLDSAAEERLGRSLFHLEQYSTLESRFIRKQGLLDWMEKVDKIGSWRMDNQGNIHWSDGIRRIVESGGRKLTKSFTSGRKFVHPEDLEVYDRANAATFDEGWSLDFEYRILDDKGTTHHLHVVRHVETGGDGTITGAFGMVRDISLHKEFEDILFRRDAVLQVLAGFADRFLREVDWEGGIDKTMEALGKAADVTRVFVFSKAHGDSDSETLSIRHEWVVDGVEPIIDNPVFKNQSFEEYSSWRKALLRRRVVAGHVKDFHQREQLFFETGGAKSIIIVPVFAGNTLWGFMGLSEHRMERDWLPAEIESLTMAANLFGSAIHHGLMGEKLIAANQSAEEASAAALEASLAKSMFLANMSHEIRTPISGILGMAEMMVTTGLTDEQREHMNMIRDAAGSLLHIVNDILDLSKIEAGKMELKPIDFSFRPVLSTSVRSFGPQAELNNIVFQYSVDDDVPARVNGDADRLGQVLWNLIGNSIKFTERGLVELTVSVSKQEAGRTCLLFKVRDTGVGIAQDKLETIFDNFTQADSSLRKKHQGTGLGLAISRKLVNMMGGEIGVESEVGRGSTFFFTAWFGVVANQTLVEEEARPKLAKGLHLNLLLAEDNPLNRKYLNHFLTMFGHTVTSVENGLEVLSALESKGKEIDLILMDVQMPEMSGIEATRAIRESNGKRYDRTIPIIALTAYAMKGDRERMIDAGMDDYVSKPVDMHALSDAIVRCMAGRESVGVPPHLLGKSPLRKRVESVPVPVSLDMDSLTDRFEGNMELLKDILELFVIEAEEKLEKLDAGIKEQALKKVGVALHSITNIASHVLAMDIMAQSRSLEKLCYLGKLEQVIEGIEEMRPQFAALVTLVKKEVEKL
ncbi:ATP-binding protein [Pseudodesulfovibrio sediminis]|uniref:histidine kinase n=1 Tax=Pseudodesulfovibrio sediminis TaxID=2810563 RepID=A0ABN6ER82_9BACT|nr:ATP-binding protein [Pseudodesulfovibrio sediminis]BCS88906.1 hypothetical protein PSDVSF_21480 [Pseudodesulfovibrio sediminis]